MNRRLLAIARLEEQLIEVLVRALGDEAAAREILDDAIAGSTWESVPSEPRRIAIFAYAHLVPRVAERVGARAALLMLDELDVALKADQPEATRSLTPAPRHWQSTDAQRVPSSSKLGPVHPSSARQPATTSSTAAPNAPQAAEIGSGVRVRRYDVVVLESRAFERSQLARHLLAGECDVVACSGVDDELRTVARADAIVFDPSDVDLLPLLAHLESMRPSPTVVVRSTLSKAALLERFPHPNFTPAVVVPRSASLRELVWAVRRAVAARDGA